MRNILVIERHRFWQDFLNETLQHAYTLYFLKESDDPEKEVHKRHYILIILDLESFQKDAFELIRWLTAVMPFTPVVVTSEEEKAEMVVRAIKLGAYDFLTKPYSSAKMRHTVEQAIEDRRLKNEIDYLRHEQDIIYDFDRIISESSFMQEVIRMLKKFSRVDSTILITGETGTGKSFLAGTIHFNSERKKKPFVHVNCANLPESLLESELFGHEKGAFTGANKTRIGRFEQAHGGTLFLDEIGELPLSIQAKLLRVLEEKSFERIGGNKTIFSDTRIIAATNRRLEKLLEEGNFREDLYFRLNILNARLPPLRQRRECIEPLARSLLQKYCTAMGRSGLRFEATILEWIKTYNWPGNIRELANSIERAVILEEGREIGWESFILPEIVNYKTNGNENGKAKAHDVQNEKDLIVKILSETNWVQKDAAERLGISPRALNYKVKKYNITHPRWRKHK